jgi:hypothetical protein
MFRLFVFPVAVKCNIQNEQIVLYNLTNATLSTAVLTGNLIHYLSIETTLLRQT